MPVHLLLGTTADILSEFPNVATRRKEKNKSLLGYVLGTFLIPKNQLFLGCSLFEIEGVSLLNICKKSRTNVMNTSGKIR